MRLWLCSGGKCRISYGAGRSSGGTGSLLEGKTRERCQVFTE